jgi:DNA-binding MarR family transcriptional regulator
MSDETSALNGYLLWQAANLWQKKIRAVLAPFGVTPVQFLLLSGLDEIGPLDGKPVNQAALARHCNCDAMMTSQVLRALEKNGSLRRTAHKTDRRATAVAITQSGRNVVNQAAGQIRDADAGFHNALGVQSVEFGDALRLLCGKRPRRRVKAIRG